MSLEPEAAAFPDLADPEAEDWLVTTARRARSLVFAPALELLDRTLPEGSPEESGPMGPLGSSRFRRLVLALLAADWACYDGDQRAELERLALCAARFPPGFRLWAARPPHRGALIPLGCAAWFPVASGTADALCSGLIPGRAVVPDRLGPERYVWSYGIAPGFRRTAASKALLQALARDLAAGGSGRVCCVVVSDSGARVARRLGLERAGGTPLGEEVFASPTPARDARSDADTTSRP